MNKINISVILPSVGRPCFVTCIKSLDKTCTKPRRVEILVKVDSAKVEQKYIPILNKSRFRYKIVVSRKPTGFKNNHKMLDMLCKIAKGKIFLLWSDDCVVQGDWYADLIKTRNMFPDNIYAVNTRYQASWSYCPAISREWFEALGSTCPIPAADGWIRDIAKRIGRHVRVSTMQAINQSDYKRYHHKKIPNPKGEIRRLRPSAIALLKQKIAEFKNADQDTNDRQC